MDFKALMTKLETIDKKQVLTESEDRPDAKKKETTWTDKSGKKHPATSVQGHQSVKADKESDKEKKKNDRADEAVFKSSIAKALAEEFGYELEEQSIEEADATNPWANDPAKSAAWAALSPEDQQWLGGADPTDPYILARAPNKGKPATTRSIGAGTKPADAPAAPTGTQVQTDDEGNHMITTPDGKTMVVGPDGKPLPNGGKADAGAATKPAAVDPAVAATREKFKALMDKLEKTGGVSGAAPAAAPAKKPATGAATKPAAKPTVGQLPMKQQAATAAGTDPNAVNDQGMAFGGGGLEEQSRLADDQILALIKSI